MRWSRVVGIAVLFQQFNLLSLGYLIPDQGKSLLWTEQGASSAARRRPLEATQQLNKERSSCLGFSLEIGLMPVMRRLRA